MHHIRKEPKNNYLLWNLAIQIYTTGSYQLPMLSINLFNRDYTCLSMAGQNIKPCMHNAFFFFQIWMMYEPAFENNYFCVSTCSSWNMRCSWTQWDQDDGQEFTQLGHWFLPSKYQGLLHWRPIVYCRAEQKVSQFRLPEEF